VEIQRLYQEILGNSAIVDPSDRTALIESVKAIEKLIVDVNAPSYYNLMHPQKIASHEIIKPSPQFANFTDFLKSVKSNLKGCPVRCYLSYETASESIVQLVSSSLADAGITLLNQERRIGDDLSDRFYPLKKADFILVFGTPEYQKRCQETSLLSDDLRYVQMRYRERSKNHSVLKILLEGNSILSFPNGLDHNQDDLADLRSPDAFFSEMLILIETLYWSYLGEKPDIHNWFKEAKQSFSPIPKNNPFLLSQKPPLIAEFRREYEKHCYLERFLDKKLVHIDQTFVQLAIVLEEEQKEKEKNAAPGQ